MLKPGRGSRQAYLSNCLRTYSCVYCRAHLANHDELISKQFLGSHGPAYLFNSVVNVGCGPSERRDLSTGAHIVADIYCENCKTTLGWKYEHAFKQEQKYKEGKYIIELTHMLKENDWDLTSYNANSILIKDTCQNGDNDTGGNYCNNYRNRAKRRQHYSWSSSSSNSRFSQYQSFHNGNYFEDDNTNNNNNNNKKTPVNIENNTNKYDSSSSPSSSATTQPRAILKPNGNNMAAILAASSSISPSTSSALSCSPSISEASSSSSGSLSDAASSLEGPSTAVGVFNLRHRAHLISKAAYNNNSVNINNNNIKLNNINNKDDGDSDDNNADSDNDDDDDRDDVDNNAADNGIDDGKNINNINNNIIIVTNGNLQVSYSTNTTTSNSNNMDNNSQDSNGECFYDCCSDNDILAIDDK